MAKSAKYYLKSSYSLGWDKNSLLDKERLQLISKFVQGKKVLDVGCGYGLYVDYLNKQGIEATGLDFVDEFIKFAKETKKGTFIKGEAEKLPFQDNFFDTIILFDILEHGDDIKILKEAKRVSEKAILVIVPKKVDYQLEQSGVIFRHYLDKSHLREYEREDIIALAKRVDVRLDYIEPVHPLYNETIFLSLFKGSIFVKKIVRKLIFFLLPKNYYFTEYFAVFKK